MGWLAFLVVLLSINYVSIRGAEVTYDARSLIIDGQRKILFSGSIHYPRSTPDMWPDLIRKGKEGGLDVIETYVFWNVHEPQPGQYDFSGRYDLVKFIKEIQAQGLYACLRIGPFIQAEWNYGGLPYWLHDVPGVVYRTDNLLFKYYMEEFVTKIVNLMKSEGLFASQGGPIILSQIENEYGNIESAFGADGPKYVNWAAKMAVGLNTGVPWVMCKQQDAPDPVINTCNGMRCGETFAGPNSPAKPSLWTENWTSFLQKWGDGPYKRDAEDIAFQVALWIAKNGSFVNYYMYHGGTNLGRTSAGYMVTTYYDQAPLDEYGLKFQNKYGHLKDLHAAVKMCAKPLLHGKQMISSMGEFQQAFVFQEEDEACVAFLLNDDIAKATVQFRNASFELPPKSISILGDCKNEIYNTAKVTAEYNEKIVTTIETFNAAERWEVYKDEVPNYDDNSLKLRTILEQTNTTKDKTDYLWYTLSYTSNSVCTNSELSVTSLSHVSHAFVNGKYIGGAHSSHNATGAITTNYPMQLSEGSNNISILSGLVGLPDSGAHVERRYMGIKGVEIKCNRETRDNIRDYKWGYQVGLKGEGLKIYSDEKLGNVEWSKMSNSTGEPLTWYKTMLNGPLGNDPVALNLSSMGKGEVWVNGQSIGRYWISFHTVDGIPSQVLFHIPRSFLKPLGNSLILFEEEGGNPLKISLNTIQVKTSHDSLPQKN